MTFIVMYNIIYKNTLMENQPSFLVVLLHWDQDHIDQLTIKKTSELTDLDIKHLPVVL